MLAGAMDEDLDVNLREPDDASGFLDRHFFGDAEPENFKLALREYASGASPQIVRTFLLFKLTSR